MGRLVGRLARVGRAAIGSGRDRPDRGAEDRARTTAGTTTPGVRGQRPAYPGDHPGPFPIEYAPVDDDRPDPGEVVWAWVPFEEDHTQGKDRPVLVVGHDGAWLLALMLTSKDHDRDAVHEAHRGRHWMDVGAGAWDASRRPSEVRLDRVLRLDPATVRREGAALEPELFRSVAEALGQLQHGPS
jgi:hypothetical protein